MQFLSENRLNGCQFFGRFGVLKTESKHKFGFPQNLIVAFYNSIWLLRRVASLLVGGRFPQILDLFHGLNIGFPSGCLGNLDFVSSGTLNATISYLVAIWF